MTAAASAPGRRVPDGRVPDRQVPGRRVLWSALIDLLAVLLFAVIGRASHAEGLTLGGILETAWPFLAALVIGWIVLLAWRSPAGLPLPGVPLWVITVAVGMLLRSVSGQGTATPFIIVATIALGVLLLGWRAIWRLLPASRRASGG